MRTHRDQCVLKKSLKSLGEVLAGLREGAGDRFSDPQVGITRANGEPVPRPMKARTGPERVGSLVIELAARTAKIDGTRVELPPTEFALLAVLAARPGEVVSHKILAAEAFGEGAHIAPQDLHWRIWKLRDLIGDGGREHKLVENRRGQGYVLDLPPNAVQVVEGVAPGTAPVDDVIRLEEQPVPTDTGAATLADEPAPDSPVRPPIAAPDGTPDEDSGRTRPRPLAVLVGVAITLGALAGSWSAGYLISSRLASQEQATVPPPTDKATTSSVADPEPQTREHKRAERRKPNKAPKKSRKARSQDEPTAVAAAPAPAPPPPSSQSGSGSEAPNTQPAKKQKAPAPLPPPPTRFLYHLVNAENGDHFVTTDGNVASQYHARGYEGGAIGRVYTSAMKGTRAISTNQGTAYIFIEANPKTEPASRTVALWYSTNNGGDFFYTTSEAEAKQSGWSARVVGYIGVS